MNVNRSKEVWVESQTLNRVVSAQVAHLFSQQQPEDEEGKMRKRRRNEGEETHVAGRSNNETQRQLLTVQ